MAMKDAACSYQKAAYICKKEGLDFHYLRTGEKLLLWSGAKIFRRDKTYFISGYSFDGGDVDCYFSN